MALPEGWAGEGRPWRLLRTGPGDGPFNMGVDAAILEGRAAGTSPPTLRLYWWSRPTLSLGRFQDEGDVDLDAVRSAGADAVRRPTGGRGVLHDAELTYSIVAGVADGLPPGVAASYGVLCAALAAAYAALGVRAEMTSRSRGSRSPACYLQATQADLSLGGAKLSGSAQVWRGDACLQHGSLTLRRDSALEARLLGLSEEEAARLEERTASLSGALGRDVSREEADAALVAGVAETLGVRLVPGELSEEEVRRAREMAPAMVVIRPKG